MARISSLPEWAYGVAIQSARRGAALKCEFSRSARGAEIDLTYQLGIETYHQRRRNMRRSSLPGRRRVFPPENELMRPVFQFNAFRVKELDTFCRPATSRSTSSLDKRALWQKQSPANREQGRWLCRFSYKVLLSKGRLANNNVSKFS